MCDVSNGRPKPRVVLVDPYSTGGMLAPELASRGFEVIALWTWEVGENRGHLPKAAEGFPEGFLAEVDERASLAETAEALLAAAGAGEVAAVMCGGETGVKVTDALAEHMGLRGNTTAHGMENRRDKLVQQEAVRASGLRAARSVCGRSWAKLSTFAEAEALPIVVKPVESAGTDGVKLCHSVGEAHSHFDLLMASQRKCGAQGAAVLIQEFLRGTEYVVDTVTRDGEHKCVMVYVYERRGVDGGDFVCFGQRGVFSDSAEAQQLIAYTFGCLDALRITDGAAHTEVMMTDSGPCLVEVNSRCQGAAGGWIPLARALTGYDQVEAVVDAFLRPESFALLPTVPPSPFKACGEVVIVVSHQEGILLGAPGFDRIRSMRSFVSLEEAVHIGERLERTVDVFTIAGFVVLISPDATVLEEDVAAIRAMEVDGSLFDVSDVDDASDSLVALKAEAPVLLRPESLPLLPVCVCPLEC